MGALVGVQPGFPTAAMDGDRPATEGTPSDDELRRRLAALNVERVSQGLKPRSFRDFKKSFLRPGRRTRNGLLLEDYPQAEASSVAADAGTVLQERDMLPPRPPASKRAKTEDVPGEVSLRSASEVRGQMETEDANLAEASSTESLVAPEGQEIILRSVSELREFAGEHRSPGHSREEASSSGEAGAPVPNYHIQVEVQANRRNPRLAHHWFGEKITVVKDLVRGRPIPRQITLHRLGKGNSRVVYEWGAFVVKFTTVVVDHGDEEQLTVLLPEVTALVIHVVPVIARMGPSQGAARHVVFALIQKKVIMAQSWLEGLDAATHRHWHYYLACIVAWLSSRGLNLADVTVSNLGLETQDGHLQLFDLATWRVTGVAKWRSGSGFERYLRDRCPEVLEKIRHLQDRAPVKMFEAFVQEAGPFVNHLVHKGLARLQNGHMMMNDKGIIQPEAGDVLP